jgi:hypothetical protein
MSKKKTTVRPEDYPIFLIGHINYLLMQKPKAAAAFGRVPLERHFLACISGKAM